MLSYLAFAFLEGLGPALAERAPGAASNPAALAIKPGASLYGWYLPKDTSWGCFLGLGPVGGGYLSDGSWFLTSASSLFEGRVALGTSWYPRTGAEDIGITLRPNPWASVGLVARDALRTPTWELSLGLRPLTHRITLFGNGTWRDSLLGWEAGLGVEPLSGLVIYSTYSDENRLTAGVSVSLGNLRVAGGASLGDGELEQGPYQVELSEKPYPSVYTPKRTVRLSLEGYSSEDGRKGIIALSPGKRFVELLEELRGLAEDPSVEAVALELGGGYSLAQCYELKKEVEKLRKRGKAVIAYGEVMGAGDYLVASAADLVALHPSGQLDLRGFAAGGYYLKGLMDKLGVSWDVLRIADYKTAGEPLVMDTMSAAQREQLSEFLDDLWDSWTWEVSQARGITQDSVAGLLDQGPYTAKGALGVGLVDTLVPEDQLDELVAGYLGKRGVKFKGTHEGVPRWWVDPRPKIGVLVAEGSIVSGKGGPTLLGGKSVGEELAEALERMRKDRSIRAVVLRVNSPGGSALGSEKIWRQAWLLAREKPLVVSMGATAASGGYYIASPGSLIVVTPYTLTGSIGIIAVRPVMKGLYSKVGVNKQMLGRGKRALLWDEAHPWTQEERELVMASLREGYDTFVKRVSEGRGLSVDSVDALGRGRIWSGISAVEIGLCDTLGGLMDAVELAGQMAGVRGPYRLIVWPPKTGILGQLARLLGMGPEELVGAPADWMLPFLDRETFYYLETMETSQ